jgi:hypothetical protein
MRIPTEESRYTSLHTIKLLSQGVSYQVAERKIYALVSDCGYPVGIGAEERVVVTEQHAKEHFSDDASTDGPELGRRDLLPSCDRDRYVRPRLSGFREDIRP